ncbi:MAG: ABC transporter permease, partial [Ilumatobacteraceae bacterium]
MKLALRELVRRPGRFVTATAILTLIAILLMFLGGLLDGLIATSTGAVRAQAGDVVVYSDTSRSSFLRSRIEPDVRAAIEATEGVDEVGGLGVVLIGARVPGNGPRDLADVALWGYELAPLGVPVPPSPGEVYADDVLRSDGVELGDELLLGPARTPVTVVGWVSDTSFNGQGGLWTDLATWRDVLLANRPGAGLADGVVQALVVSGPGTPGQTAAAVTRTPGVTALTIDEAVDA